MLALTDALTDVHTMFSSVAPDVKMTQYVQWQYMDSNAWYWKDMPQWCSDLHEHHHLQKLAGFQYDVPYCRGSQLYVRFVVNFAEVDWTAWFPISPVSIIFGFSDANRA